MLTSRGRILLKPNGLPKLGCMESTSTAEVSPVYPEIRDISFRGRARLRAEAFANLVREKSSYEEKMMEINMPRIYGWTTYIIRPTKIVYNSEKFYKKITRTGMITTENIPLHSHLDAINDLEKIKVRVIDTLEAELDYLKSVPLAERLPTEKDENLRTSKYIASVLSRALMLSAAEHDVDQVDIEEQPRCDAFWLVGGFHPPPIVKKCRTKYSPEWLRKEIDENEPVAFRFQYLGEPLIQLQSKHPLGNSVGRDSAIAQEIEVPYCPYHPSSFELMKCRYYGTNVNSTWPHASDKTFTTLSWLPFSCAYGKSGKNDIKEFSDNLAVVHGFGSMLAQACKLGFSPVNKITYPMTTQVIVGDGQYLSFYQYQLNTNVLDPLLLEENDPKNICWSTPMHRLYECVENGRIKGLDENVLLMLVNAFRVKSVKTHQELSPYFGDVKYISDLPDVEKRKSILSDFKEMYSNRPQHRRKRPEIYDWKGFTRYTSKQGHKTPGGSGGLKMKGYLTSVMTAFVQDTYLET